MRSLIAVFFACGLGFSFVSSARAASFTYSGTLSNGGNPVQTYTVKPSLKAPTNITVLTVSGAGSLNQSTEVFKLASGKVKDSIDNGPASKGTYTLKRSGSKTIVTMKIKGYNRINTYTFTISPQTLFADYVSRTTLGPPETAKSTCTAEAVK